MKKFFVLVLFILTPIVSYSQNKLGLGIYLGVPIGVTGKYLLTRDSNIDALLAWRFNNAFFMQTHYNFVFELDRYKNGSLNFYLGPGVFFVAASNYSGLGASGNFGVNYFLKYRYEFFLEISPKFSLIPGTGFDVTGGIGFRFYF
ncbi:MAG: hypothetical protein ABDI07_03570 [Candidatus Kryptonium sp.]